MTFLVLLSAFCAAGAAVRAKVDVSPVEKVLTLMNDLKSQVESEGAAEAETYNKFACFCKDKQLEKESSIQTGDDDEAQQKATLQQQEAEKNMLASDIADLNAVVANSDSVLKGLESKRNEEYEEYLVEHKDVGDSVTGVKVAIEMVKNGMGLIQIQNSKKTEKVAVALQAKLQGDGGESGAVMEVLEMLETDWSKKLKKIEDEETARVDAYDKAVAAQHLKVEESKEAINTKTDFMADCEATIADYTGRLTETRALKSDDKTYLKDLTAQCARKATEWDQRSKMRADELEALGKAIDIINGDVKTAAEDSGAGGRTAVAPVESLVQARKAAAEADPEDYRDVVFLQEAKKDKNSPADRLKAITAINKASKSLKSPELSLLAMTLAADPFAKVKTLIQQLIERLMTESANEATHKGWCDTEVATATSHRDFRYSDTKNLAATVMVQESRKTALSNEIVKLTDEISALNTAYTERTRLRSEEKAENKQTLESAQEGLKALTQAIEVLSSFYRKAGRATVLLQEKAPVTSSPVAADMVGSEYKGGAYQGNQAASSGIMGMLETIKSDFQRTIDETSSSEKQSSEEYAQFSEETKASISGKETGLKNANAELKITSGDMVRSLNDLGDNQKLLDQSLEALETLRSACIDTGMTWEDKVAKREAEIAALKSALEIFNEEGGLGFLQK